MSHQVDLFPLLEVIRAETNCIRCNGPLPERRSLRVKPEADGDTGWLLIAQIGTDDHGRMIVEAHPLCLDCAEDAVTFIEGSDVVEPPPRANRNGDDFKIEPTEKTFEGVPVYTRHVDKGQ